MWILSGSVHRNEQNNLTKPLIHTRHIHSCSLLCTQLLQPHKCMVFETLCTNPAALEATWHSPFSVQVAGEKKWEEGRQFQNWKISYLLDVQSLFPSRFVAGTFPNTCRTTLSHCNTVLGGGCCTVKICSPPFVPLSLRRFTLPNLKPTFRCSALFQIHCRNWFHVIFFFLNYKYFTVEGIRQKVFVVRRKIASRFQFKVISKNQIKKNYLSRKGVILLPRLYIYIFWRRRHLHFFN